MERKMCERDHACKKNVYNELRSKERWEKRERASGTNTTFSPSPSLLPSLPCSAERSSPSSAEPQKAKCENEVSTLSVSLLSFPSPLSPLVP